METISEQKDHLRLVRTVGAAVMVGVVLLGVETAVQEDASVSQPEFTIADYANTACPDIPEAETEAIATAMEAPANPIIEKSSLRYDTYRAARRLRYPVDVQDTNSDGFWRQETDTERAETNFTADTKRDIAQELGLTMFNPAVYVDPIRQDVLRGKYEQPFADYLEAGQGYLSNFNVSLETQSDRSQEASGYYMPTNSQLETLEARASTTAIIEAFSELPLEYFEMIGAKDVRLVASDDAHQGRLAYTDVDETANNGIIYINIRYNVNSGYVKHELMHLLQEQLCGGWDAMEHVPNFDRLNGTSVYNGEYGQSPEGTEDEYRNKLNSLRSATEQEDEDSAYRRESLKLAADVKYASLYGKSSVWEDFAEVGKVIGTPNSLWAASESGYTVVDAKQRYIMALIKRHSPAIAAYFVQINPGAVAESGS